MKRIKPYKKILLPVFLFTWLCSPCPAEVELSPISISSYWDLGHVMNGTLDAPDDLEHSILNRLGAGITQKITYNQVFDVNIGVGGIFWTPFPMQAGAPWTFNTYFGPGLSQANGLYKWGDLEEPSAEFQVGLFNYKYNPEARNLGEYLFRSNAYPNILISGGWSYMNSAAYPVIGYRLGLSHFGGFFNHDFIVAVEMQNYPPQSISPAWVGTLNSGGIFEFGLGISFQHLLALSRDLITTKSLADPQTPFNRIVEFGDFPAIKPQTT